MPLFPPRMTGGLGAQMEQPAGGLGGFFGGALGGLSRFNENHPGMLMAGGYALQGEDIWPAAMYGAQVRKERKADTAKAANELKVKRLLKSKGYTDEEIEGYMAAGATAQLLAPTKAKTDDITEYQFAVENGQFKGTFTDWQTKGVRDQDPTFMRESQTRRDYDTDDSVKAYKKIRDSYERIRSSATSDSGPGDIGLIFNFMKMLDPGSVVRENEFATAQNAGGVEESIRSTYNSLMNGERLTPEQRQQFVQAADSLYAEASGNLSETNRRWSDIATGWELDPSRIVQAPEKYPPLKLGQKRKLPNNVTIERVGD